MAAAAGPFPNSTMQLAPTMAAAAGQYLMSNMQPASSMAAAAGQYLTPNMQPASSMTAAAGRAPTSTMQPASSQMVMEQSHSRWADRGGSGNGHGSRQGGGGTGYGQGGGGHHIRDPSPISFRPPPRGGPSHSGEGVRESNTTRHPHRSSPRRSSPRRSPPPHRSRSCSPRRSQPRRFRNPYDQSTRSRSCSPGRRSSRSRSPGDRSQFRGPGDRGRFRDPRMAESREHSRHRENEPYHRQSGTRDSNVRSSRTQSRDTSHRQRDAVVYHGNSKIRDAPRCQMDKGGQKRRDSGANASKPSDKLPEDYVCNICSLRGHWRLDCPDRDRNDKRRSDKCEPGSFSNLQPRPAAQRHPQQKQPWQMQLGSDMPTSNLQSDPGPIGGSGTAPLSVKPQGMTQEQALLLGALAADGLALGPTAPRSS